MKTRKLFTRALPLWLTVLGIAAASAAEPPGLPLAVSEKTGLDKLVGQPVDIAPWAYCWRADRAVQERPEAYFIPRRLERINKVPRQNKLIIFFAVVERCSSSSHHERKQV
jgi:hypothetical protein